MSDSTEDKSFEIIYFEMNSNNNASVTTVDNWNKRARKTYQVTTSLLLLQRHLHRE